VLEYLSIGMSLIDGDSERATYKWADWEDRVQANMRCSMEHLSGLIPPP